MILKSITIIFLILFGSAEAFSKNSKTQIAVMDFNADGVNIRLARVVSNMVRSRMINSNKFTVLERGQMDSILKEQGFQMSGCTDNSCAVEMGRLLSARKIMVGEVSSMGGSRIVINIRIVDVEKGISEYSEEEMASSEEYIDQAVDRISVKLVSRIEGKEVKGLKEVRTVKMTDEERSLNGWKATGLSIVPGLGQYVYGDSFALIEGTFFLGGTSALGYFTYYYYNDMKDKRKIYSDLAPNLSQSTYDSKYDDMKKSEKMYNILMLSTAGFYLLNFVDAYFAGSRPDTKTVVGSAYEPSGGFYAGFPNFSSDYSGSGFVLGYRVLF